MRKRTSAGTTGMVLAVLILLLAGGSAGFAGGSRQRWQPRPFGPGHGMMGRAPAYGAGPGGPFGGYHRGYPGGMMSGYRGGYPQGYGPGVGGERISAEQAQAAVTDALAFYGKGDLEVAELMEFELNFYAQIRKKGSELNAFELLVDPYSGGVYPEPGPNMMWNTAYGHMSRGWFRGSRAARIDGAAAQRIASDWLKRFSASATAGDVEPFPGYYTLHVYENGAITGMLSVHARSGDVWYHDWHGTFIEKTEY